MYNLSHKFNTFYRSYVVLPQSEQTNLKKKAQINIDRLIAGLSEYNKDNDTDYAIVDSCIQGSVAMYTAVQNENNDFDIDVAIVFDKTNLNGKGARAARNLVADALRRKTKQFNTEPVVKTSCVRVKYATGYHIDFAVYRREKVDGVYVYEHAGNDWQQRELRALTNWFTERNNETDLQLRRLVRLSKMFCQSRPEWKMPSGIVQTVVIDEKFTDEYTRLDELFYWTMKSIVDRLADSVEVFAPVDNGRALVTRESDSKRMRNWKNRLSSKLKDLDILFDDNCTENDAISAWACFFNHDYWSEQVKSEAYVHSASTDHYAYNDTEQYIEDMFEVNLKYRLRVLCEVSGNGFRPTQLRSFLNVLHRFVPHHFKVQCSVSETNVPEPYDVYWKVRNVGPVAQRKNDIRGQIVKRGKTITENTRFFGEHYIECYIVKNGVCVACDHIDVPIGRS